MRHQIIPGLLTATAVLFLTACSSWPEHGCGGAAESVGVLPVCAVTTDHTTESSLDHRLGCALERFADLRLQGAALVVPGLVQRAQIQADRTIRELTGRLYGDAQYDLEILGAQLDQIERHLNDAQRDQQAAAPKGSSSGAHGTLEQFAAKLECNAQFDTASSELDPRFAALLARIGSAMLTRPDVSVRVVGHTDDVGSEAANINLADDRSEAVRSVLLAAGVEDSRVTGEAAGEASPLFNMTTPAARLANRRVEVQLRTPQGPLAAAPNCLQPVAMPAS